MGLSQAPPNLPTPKAILGVRSGGEVGDVSQVTGLAHLTKGQTTFDIHEGTPVGAGDRLATEAGASITITIGDRRVTWRASEFVFDAMVAKADKTEPKSRGHLWTGIVCLDLKGFFHEVWDDFGIWTANAIVRVTAKQAKVSVTYAAQSATYNGSSTEVVLMEGSLAVSI